MRRAVWIAAVLFLLALAGCGRADPYALPEEPLAFETWDFTNPEDPDDGYRALEYDGKVYLPYGTLAGRIGGHDIARCLGYVVQDGEADPGMRIYTLSDDPDGSYLMEYYVNGIMEQPMFLRAVDTAGEEIHTPEYIDSLGYAYWEQTG